VRPGLPMIIPFFLMNRGCRHRCLFCNERLTAGGHPPGITAGAVRRSVEACLGSHGGGNGPVQIAFYGGTFTGLPHREQLRLLALAAPFLREGSVTGIRISTRPDEIDAATLDLLQAGGVQTVELGAQSLDDGVLMAARRGHSAADTVRAHTLLKAGGFETGLHLMAGLPEDTPERFAQTVSAAIALNPDMVRIHPTLVLRDTLLAKAFTAGRYRPLTLDQAVSLCKDALQAFAAAGIPVIRLGLQTTRELEAPGAVVAGPFHPAFRSLVEAEIYLEMSLALMAAAGRADRDAAADAAAAGDLEDSPDACAGNAVPPATMVFTVADADLSHFRGMNGRNVCTLKERHRSTPIRIVADPSQPRRTLILAAGDQRWMTDGSGRIVTTGREDLHASGGHDRDAAV
jgi:radical SAM superfamily enzyme